MSKNKQLNERIHAIQQDKDRSRQEVKHLKIYYEKEIDYYKNQMDIINPVN